MARFSKVALQAGIPFGALMSVFWMLVSSGSFVFAVTLGVGCGVIFGLLLAAFAQYQLQKFAGYDPTNPTEKLLRHGQANHWKRRESVGGYLYLTNERLIFISHKFNLQNHRLSIPLEEISSVRPCQTLVFVPNGLEIVRDADKERFVVHNRRGWIRELQEQLSRHGR